MKIEELVAISSLNQLLNEAEAWHPQTTSSTLEDQIQEVQKMLDLAKRTVGIVNKLSATERAKYGGRVFANLNRVRALFNRLFKRAEKEYNPITEHTHAPEHHTTEVKERNLIPKSDTDEQREKLEKAEKNKKTFISNDDMIRLEDGMKDLDLDAYIDLYCDILTNNTYEKEDDSY